MKCKNCGQELSNDMRFCTNCGSPVEIPKPTIQKGVKSFGVIASTTSSIPNYRIMQVHGIISATIANFKENNTVSMAVNMFSGKLGEDSFLAEDFEKDYNKVLKRLFDKVKANNCNAIIGLRYSSNFVGDHLCLTAYGTACIIEQE